MSEIIEGLICGRNKTVNADIPDAKFEIRLIAGHSIVLSNSRTFSPSIDELALELSNSSGMVLLFRYDSRVGYRFSQIYEAGHLMRTFTERDEIYVMLDADGDPLIEGEKFKREALSTDPNNEYETYKNAIEMGMEEAKISVSWQQVKDAVLA